MKTKSIFEEAKKADENSDLTGLTADLRHKPKLGAEYSGATHEARTMLDLLHNVSKKVSSGSELAQIVNQITKMTQQALNASASSVLLLDDKGRELIFEVAEGKARKILRQARLDTKSGIVGWVVCHGKPMIVNDVTESRYFNRNVDEATGFITRSVICAPLVVGRRMMGAIEVLNKKDGTNFSQQDLETLVSVASTAAMSIQNTRLHQAILDAYKSSIKALAAAIDAKDHYTHGHSQRVMDYAQLGGRSLLFSDEDMEVLEYAGILHDIGKIGIADSILAKPGALTNEEWELMRQHSVIGFNILSAVTFLEKSRKLILYHHERYDGKGYPEGIKGEAIPMGARLIAIADAFDSMTTDRSYRTALGVDNAIRELHICSGKQFCPVAVDAFTTGLRKLEKN